MGNEKWLTELSVEDLKAKILPKPHKPFEIDGIPVFLNTENLILPDEIFKNHPKLPIEVSNLGRVKFNGKILFQFPDISQLSPYGYLLVRFKNKNHRVYVLVAETWCERPDPNVYKTVHHISNNGMDNRVSNLLWVTTEQHEEIHPFLKNLKKGKR